MDDAVHPPPTHRPNLYYMQQHSSAAVRTAVHLVRGEQLVGWFLERDGTPEVCLLPAGMAVKNKLVLYYPLYVSTKIK